MNNKTLHTLVIIFLCSCAAAGTDNRQRAMGSLSWSLPDINASVNLYQFAGNRALLMQNDSSGWLNYSTNGLNNQGNLRRAWDADRNNFYTIGFSGQKKIGSDQMFSGDIRYIWDYRGNQHYAIEKYPYAADPFVLADFTTGNLLFHGPMLSAGFAQQISDNLFIGVGLAYFINRGLKDIQSEPEIISREISGAVDLAWRASQAITVGLSFAPWQNQDITKLVTLSNGLDPITRRYRGEFEFREKTGSDNRTVNSSGYEWRPQIALTSGSWQIAAFGQIGFQNQELYDGTSQHFYDGYFQETLLGWSSIARYLSTENNALSLFLKYSFEYRQSWAREAKEKLLIWRQFNRLHRVSVGGSGHINSKWIAALELWLDYQQPTQTDLLAARYRFGAISDLSVHSGLEYALSSHFSLRGGMLLHRFREAAAWQHFGNYSGAYLTTGFGWQFSNFELDTILLIGKNYGSHAKYRDHINFNVQMKQYL